MSETVGRPHDSVPVGALLQLAIATGVAVGVIEVLIVCGYIAFGRLPRVSVDVVWMAPVADAGLFATIGSLLYGARMVLPGLARPRILVAVLLGAAAFILLLTVRSLHVVALALLAVGLGRLSSDLMLRMRASTPSLLRWSRIQLLGCLAGVTTFGVTQLLSGGHPGRPALPSVQAKASPGAPNVLLIILDTVRAKSLELYGRERSTSPFLRRWAEEGVTFEMAIAPAPWTLPSHAAMLTGQPPSRLSADFDRGLDDTYPTLAEELRRQGFRTGAFVGNLLFASRSMGLDRGFQVYEDYPRSVGQTILSVAWGRRFAGWDWLRGRLAHHQLLNRKPAATIIDRFLRWQGNLAGEPFFAFLNLYDAHEPYLPPAPFDRIFTPSSDRGILQHTVSLGAGTEAVRPRKWEMSAADRELDLALYEGAIAYLDDQLRRLFEALEARGVLDETLVILTSDHGEQFGEHRLYGHTNSLYMPLLHVPLMIRRPGTVPGGASVRVPVSLRQIPATVCDLLGVDDTVFPGPSLRGTWSGRPSMPPPFSELRPGIVERSWYPSAGGTLHSIVWDGYHYIRSGDGTEEAYDLQDDPDELTNLAGNTGFGGGLDSLRVRMNEVLRN